MMFKETAIRLPDVVDGCLHKIGVGAGIPALAAAPSMSLK